MMTNPFTASALRALVLCLCGGALARLLNTPLPWMIGPMLAMAAGKLVKMELSSPRGGRQLGQILIATSLGLYFTPTVARQVLEYSPLMLLAAVAAVGLAYVCGWVVSRATNTDRTTAFFAMVPGGAAEMAVLSARFGAAVERVAVAQALRIMVVVLIVPSVLTWSGARGLDIYQAQPTEVRAGGLALLVALTALGGFMLSRFRVPNSWMLGPLFVSIALTVTEVGPSGMPHLLTNLGQLLVGCALGSRFDRHFLMEAHGYMAAVLATILMALVISALLGAGLSWVSGIPVATMALATAPGGIAEMCITAEVLRLGVPLVTAFHVTRVILLVTCTAPIYKLAMRLRGAR